MLINDSIPSHASLKQYWHSNNVQGQVQRVSELYDQNTDCKERAAVIHTWILKMLTWIDIYWNVVQESWFQSYKNEVDDKML